LDEESMLLHYSDIALAIQAIYFIIEYKLITMMDTTNAIIQLCIQGTRAEFEHRLDDAHRLYQQAWDLHIDDYEACIAAHYVARFQPTPEAAFRWNQIALEHADRVSDNRAREFYPSLYLNLGRSHEILGNHVEMQKYYELAAQLGVTHQHD
jgi:hypothetical protein